MAKGTIECRTLAGGGKEIRYFLGLKTEPVSGRVIKAHFSHM